MDLKRRDFGENDLGNTQNFIVLGGGVYSLKREDVVKDFESADMMRGTQAV